MNVTIKRPKTPSKKAVEKLQEAALRIRTPMTANDIWFEMFTEIQRERLGGDFDAAYAKGGSIKMWSRVHGCTEVRAVIEIAYLFDFLTPHVREWLLAEAGELLDADAAYDDAILRNELVLNSLTREVHWMGESIELDWSHDAKWSFIWELAKHAKTGLPIDSTTFGGQKSADYVSKMKSELSKLDSFPIDLADSIVVVARGAQKLSVKAHEIRLFEHYVGGEIREWTPPSKFRPLLRHNT